MMRENGDGGSDAFGAGNELETTSFSAAGGRISEKRQIARRTRTMISRTITGILDRCLDSKATTLATTTPTKITTATKASMSETTSTSETKEERQMDAAEQWLGDHHNKFFKNVVKELSMDEDGWRAAKKQFAMRKEIIKDAANMKKMEGYRSMIVLALEVATAIGALVSFKNWVESDIYIRDVIDLRQIVPEDSG